MRPSAGTDRRSPAAGQRSAAARTSSTSATSTGPSSGRCRRARRAARAGLVGCRRRPQDDAVLHAVLAAPPAARRAARARGRWRSAVSGCSAWCRSLHRGRHPCWTATCPRTSGERSRSEGSRPQFRRSGLSGLSVPEPGANPGFAASLSDPDFVASCTIYVLPSVKTTSRGVPGMHSGEPGLLPLSATDVEKTRLPVEQATMLPGAAFTDPAVLEWEIENIFLKNWVCAGHIDQVSKRGQYLMVELGGESVFVIADDDGLPRAFHNSCRHRGARLVDAPEGSPPAPAVSLPRVVLRVRRQPQERAVHRRHRELRQGLLRPQAGTARGRRRARPARPVR